jgi:hypothetical protein
MLYDAFTITPILFLEDLGFCAKGEGGAFVSDGGIAPGGHLAVNTNGGGLSYCHPGMYGLLLLSRPCVNCASSAVPVKWTSVTWPWPMAMAACCRVRPLWCWGVNRPEVKKV